MSRPWTTKEHGAFVEMYPYFPNPYIAAKLGRTDSAVMNRAMKFGLHKHPDFKDEGLPFVRGHQTWNKGKPHSPAGSERGRFKPGHTGTRALPVGAERIHAGVLMRKVNDFHGPDHARNFRPVKDIIWEAAHGAIPKGMLVRVMTGNPLDASRIECLACLTRAENFRLNAAKHDRSAALAKAWATRRAAMENRA